MAFILYKNTIKNYYKSSQEYCFYTRLLSRFTSFKPKDNSNVLLQNNIINQLLDDYYTTIETLNTYNKEYYTETIDTLYSTYCKDLQQFHIYLSDIDVATTAAKVLIQNNYCKPEIIESTKSCLVATDIRHPIVERINDNEEYITNNISLGMDDIDGVYYLVPMLVVNPH